MTTALIDGDILVYRCGFAAEKTHYLVSEPDLIGARLYDAHRDIPKDIPKNRIWSRKEVEPVENALNALQTSIDYIMRMTKADAYEVFLSGKRSFREDIAVTKPYKGNRDTQQKPVHYSALRGYLREFYKAQESNDGLEADDLLGIRLTHLGDSGVCCSIDKDLLQIPGQHYNWVTGEHTAVDARAAHLALGCQIISGDPTDNVPGLGGLGEAKARKILKDCPNPRDMLDRIRNTYVASMGGSTVAAERYFREQGALVYILRDYTDSFDRYLTRYGNAV